ncbi:MAG: hypothetical protein V4565_09965 [Bacteroidota bacterium]
MKALDTLMTFETPLAKCWFDKDLLCLSTKDVRRTGENTKEHYWILRSMIKEKKCWLIDFNVCVDFDADSEQIINLELPKICKALALIAKSQCEKNITSFFLNVKKQNVPVKIFTTEVAARKWMKEVHHCNID